MKAEIHPQYYTDAKVTCSCGDTWTTGSTVPEIKTDICSSCHPFYTGEQRIVDTAGQVERFMKRLGQYGQHQEDVQKREQQAREKQEQRFLKQQLIALDLDEELIQILHDASIASIGDLTNILETDKDSLQKDSRITPEMVSTLETKLNEAKDTYLGEG